MYVPQCAGQPLCIVCVHVVGVHVCGCICVYCLSLCKWLNGVHVLCLHVGVSH